MVAATFTVNSPDDVDDVSPGDGVCRTTNNNKVCTLRAAILESNAYPGPDTIVLQANATYLLARGELNVYDSVTIVGAGPASTTIDANGALTGFRVLHVRQCVGDVAPDVNGLCLTSGVLVYVSGIAFRHGLLTAENSGGGIRNDGTLTLENCAITDNRVDASTNSLGAGITNFGTLSISNSIVADNTLGIHNIGGAGIYSSGPLTVFDSTISGNYGAAAPGIGGGLLTAETATITRSTISDNHADMGGGIYETGDVNHKLNLVNTTISGNSSAGDGGGLYIFRGKVGMYNVTISSNTANDDQVGAATGGGVFQSGQGTVSLIHSIITNNVHRNEGSLFDNFDDCAGTFGSLESIVTSVIAAHCTITGGYLAVGASLGPLQNNGGPTQTHALMNGSRRSMPSAPRAARTISARTS